MLNKNRSLLLLRFIVSFGLLLALLWVMRKNIGAITEILKHSNKIFLAIAVSIGVPLSIGMAYRLKLLMLGQDISMSIKDLTYLTFVGYFFNNFFPTSIGGDIVKAYYASKKTNKKSASYAAVVADRMVGFLSCISIAIIGIIFIGKGIGNAKIIWAVVTMLILSVSLVVLLLKEKTGFFSMPGFMKRGRLSKIGSGFSRLYSAVNSYRHSLPLLIKAYLFAVFMQACVVLSIYFFILCVGGEINYFKLLLIVPLVWALSMLPSLNGLGVREGAFVYFLKGDIGADMAFTVSMLWLGVVILYSIIGGMMYLFYPVKIKAKDKMGGAA